MFLYPVSPQHLNLILNDESLQIKWRRGQIALTLFTNRTGIRRQSDISYIHCYVGVVRKIWQADKMTGQHRGAETEFWDICAEKA